MLTNLWKISSCKEFCYIKLILYFSLIFVFGKDVDFNLKKKKIFFFFKCEICTFVLLKDFYFF